MARKSPVAEFFELETSRKRNNLNHYTIDQLKREGKQIQTHGDKRMQGASVVNPVKSLFKSGSLNQKQYQSTMNYQIVYEKSKQTNHSRVSYDGGIGRSTKPQNCEPSQDFLNAAAKVSRLQELMEGRVKKVMYKQKCRAAKTLKYSLILKEIVENQKSLAKFQEQHSFNQATIRAVFVEVCEIIREMGTFNSQTKH
tara:strand:+ start:90 stop:680 length:591 start_codon:yes stop_codon:yes gene_type:complete